MRKYQKEQLLDIITSLHTLHQETKIRLEKKEYQIVQTALSDCQEAAIRMGEAIERIEGEGTEVVDYLEQYCERVYETSTQLEKLTAQKFYKNLEEILIKAENAIKHMPVRKEVVFFPYKSSMWDSLESVYLAAKKDENCDAYCVPIPYYDRRADGSIGQMHYEGNEYPKNIEVIDYRAYNLEERHPDEIYIHNPYDEWNHVTCVPERYFAKNLCNYTDQLVYIPYFVLDEIEPDDQARIEGMKHFCFTPGVIYANKVIVQSEKMRQIYINEYIKAAKECGLSGEHTDRKYLESKILGTGSPKIDKVLNTKKEDLEIPEEWLKIIEKPDGTWKKIIFYNTSVSALLQNGEKMLQKMQDVFRIFKEYKDETALLWRPHPLIKATVSSMRPQLWEEYNVIVGKYIEEGWGIYDDSADIDRAVVLSDAYYGDSSSVVQLYRKTGKPVMIENVNCPSNPKAEKYILSSHEGVIYNQKLYLASEYVNALLEIDLENNNQVVIYSFPHEENVGPLYWSFKLIDGRIWFAPFNAGELLIFDCTNKEFCKISNITLDSEKNREGKFINIFHYGEFAYLIGENINSILKINIYTGEIVRLDQYIKLFEEKGIPRNSYFELPTKQTVLVSNYSFADKCDVYDDKMYIPLRYINYVLVLDLLKDEFSLIYIDCKIGRGYSHICISDGEVMLSGRNDNCIILDLKNGTKKEIYNGYIEGDAKAYDNILSKDSKKIFFCTNEEILWIRDESSEKVKRIKCKLDNEYWHPRGAYNSFGFKIVNGNDVFFQTRADAKIYRLNIANESIEEICVDISHNYYNKMVKEVIGNGKVSIEETGLIGLQNYILTL